MTLAWYGHLKFKAVPIVIVMLVSWGHRFRGILLCRTRQPPGQRGLLPAELKTMQEVITLIVFAGFTAIYFKEPLGMMQGAGFVLIALGAALVFRGQA